VVFRCNREIGATQGASCHAKTIERLGAGDFMHQVQVDVQKVSFAVGAVNHVLVPHLLGEC
jgi:ABC-type siderophore export system fused ATPase/permease subunit